jgi:hypothetical protein
MGQCSGAVSTRYSVEVLGSQIFIGLSVEVEASVHTVDRAHSVADSGYVVSLDSNSIDPLVSALQSEVKDIDRFESTNALAWS